MLVSAFRSRIRRLKNQARIQFQIDGDFYEQVFMNAPELTADAILGLTS